MKIHFKTVVYRLSVACLAVAMQPLNLDQYLVYGSLTPTHGACMEINTQLKANLKSPEAASRETLQAAVRVGH